MIDVAHNMGIHVITCDYLPDNIAHKYSDGYANISVIDKDKVLEYAESEKINGISAFACDPAVVTAAYVADKMGLPSAGPLQSIEILQNKGLFRRFLADNRFCVPFSKAYRSYEEAIKDLNDFQFPLIIKPVDSCGSKGVRRIDKAEELREAINGAIQQSFSNECIVEEYIEPQGFSSDSDSFSVDGKLSLVTFSSQRFDKNACNPYVPAGYSWPSELPHELSNELECEIQRLLSLLSMGTSIYNIETRVGKDGKAYIMEVSPRGGGNRLAECVRYAFGIDMIENSVRASMGMELLPFPEKKCQGNWAEIILHSEDSGVFKEVEIEHSIKPYLIDEQLYVNKGDSVEAFSGANQSLGTMIFKFESIDQVYDFFDNQNKYIRVKLM